MDDISAHVAAVCREAMDVPDIGVDDNLVERGADSLVAVEVVSRLQLDYGVEVADVFLATPTIGNLARAIMARRTRPSVPATHRLIRTVRYRHQR